MLPVGPSLPSRASASGEGDYLSLHSKPALSALLYTKVFSPLSLDISIPNL